MLEKNKSIIKLGLEDNKIYTIDLENLCYIGIRGKKLGTNKTIAKIYNELNYDTKFSKEGNLVCLILYNGIQYARELEIINNFFPEERHSISRDLLNTFGKMKATEISKVLKSFTNMRYLNEEKVLAKIYFLNLQKEKNIQLSEEHENFLYELIFRDRYISLKTRAKRIEKLINDKKIDYIMGIYNQFLFLRNSDILAHWDGKSMIVGYIDNCIDLNIPLEKGNFLTNLINSQKMINVKKEEITNEKLEKVANELEEKFTGFNHDIYQIVIPRCAEDFKNEALQQDNCVYTNYMKRVADGYSNIIFIRRKEDLESSLITCEIGEHNIKQYLKKYNSRVLTEEEEEFKILLQKYLEEME